MRRRGPPSPAPRRRPAGREADRCYLKADLLSIHSIRTPIKKKKIKYEHLQKKKIISI